MKRRNNDNVKYRNDDTMYGLVIMNALKWCVSHYTLNVLEQDLSNGHIVIKLQRETCYIKKPAFMKM